MGDKEGAAERRSCTGVGARVLFVPPWTCGTMVAIAAAMRKRDAFILFLGWRGGGVLRLLE